MEQWRSASPPLEQYLLLHRLRERDAGLFFRILTKHAQELLPSVYTPTVGEACEKFSSLPLTPHGLFVTAADRGKILEKLRGWGNQNIRVIVVTDGERVLGLGGNRFPRCRLPQITPFSDGGVNISTQRFERLSYMHSCIYGCVHTCMYAHMYMSKHLFCVCHHTGSHIQHIDTNPLTKAIPILIPFSHTCMCQPPPSQPRLRVGRDGYKRGQNPPLHGYRGG